LIEKRRLLLGIKGYCTDLSEQQLSNELVIDRYRYHQLWHIEQSFRMSKFDLQTRPIYHQKQDAIKAHILICFVALMAEMSRTYHQTIIARNPVPCLEHYRNTHSRQPDKRNNCLSISCKRNIEKPQKIQHFIQTITFIIQGSKAYSTTLVFFKIK